MSKTDDTPAPQPGDLYIAEHRLWRDKFSVVRIGVVTSQMAVMETFRPVTKFGLKGEGAFENESRRRMLNNLRQKLPADVDVAAISRELERLYDRQKEDHDRIEREYLAAIRALPTVTQEQGE